MRPIDAPLEPLNPSEISIEACEALWCAVLHQNRLDATASPLCVIHPKARIQRLNDIMDARRWYGSEDFRTVCSLADVDETAETAFAESLKANGWQRTRAMTNARVQ